MHGAREGALDVSEQLCLGQPVGDGGRVERDEVLIVPRAVVVIVRAMSSLPVPVSPSMSTVLFIGATSSSVENTGRIGVLHPTMLSNRNRCRSCALSSAFSCRSCCCSMALGGAGRAARAGTA